MARKIKVLGFAGSLREASYNRGVLRAAGELLPQEMELETYDLAGIPFYDGDVAARGAPDTVQHLKSSIERADALLIVTPEYNYSLPALLKNAIDWASRPPNVLSDKPIAIMGASAGPYGTTRAQLHLRQVLVYSEALVMVKPQVFIAEAGDKFDEHGNLHDTETKERVRALLAALAAWVNRLNPVVENVDMPSE